MGRPDRQKERRKEVRHWLGEGELGQDCLFDDLDPYLYAADKTLFHRASTRSHEIQQQRRELEPSALLIPRSGTVPWHIEYLSEKFELWIWAFEEDDLLREAGEYFGAQIFVGDSIPENVLELDYILCTETEWDGKQDLAEIYRAVQHHLAADGMMSVVWQGEMREGESPLAQFSKQQAFLFPEPDFVETVPLSAIANAHEYNVAEFLRRHKRFFGKNARDLCLARMNEKDFMEIARGAGAEKRAAIVLEFGAG